MTERGRGYVKVMVLYMEELQWLQQICRKEKMKYGGTTQLGCLKGGKRTLICSQISFGAVRKLELRLFAPYGRRQLCIPEVAAGNGWYYLVAILDSFVKRKIGDRSNRHPDSLRIPYSMLRKEVPQTERSRMKADTPSLDKTYLQATSLPKWGCSDHLTSYIDKRENSVVINYEEAVDSSFQMTRSLVGRIGGSQQEYSDLEAVKRWTIRSWKVPGGVKVKELSPDTFLFIFSSQALAEGKIGKHSVNGYPLFLDKWHSWSGCSRRGWRQSSTWI